MDRADQFDRFFKRATTSEPYNYQKRLATGEELPLLIKVPTGLGKTAAVVVAWLWRRCTRSGVRNRTPRRLVYCLPMRSLVEQTAAAVCLWLKNLGLTGRVRVCVLMGGEDRDDWDLHPERDAILIGTQDMLLSQALNRGYAMSRYRWPMSFGLLNNDCLWVFDEIQLMGSGLATTAQLHAFRSKLWRPAKPCQSIWMSATLEPSWLTTVDYDSSGSEPLILEKFDLANPDVKRRHKAKKPLFKAKQVMGDAPALAVEILTNHRPATRTLVVVNTVQSARSIYGHILRRLRKETARPKVLLLHSRFRPNDRANAMERLLADPSEEGSIIVSTQVIEAGVDVSATMLFTELAPWASLVQRFGRCNRAGTDDGAKVVWIDLPKEDAKQEKLAAPYDLADLRESRKLLKKCERVGASDLPEVVLEYQHRHVIRSKDLLDLFDTTPDLAGNDIDIDRFVREFEESDVQVFWRDWEGASPPNDQEAPQHQELCRVGIREFREFLKEHGPAFRWDALDHQWAIATAERIFPGQVYLLHASAGGYSIESGWDPSVTDRITPTPLPENGLAADHIGGDDLSETDVWQSIAQHTEEAYSEVDSLCQQIGLEQQAAVLLAARWHDRGKAHSVFQGRILRERDGLARPVEWRGREDLAKAPHASKTDPGWWKPHYDRKHFRHELASALAVLLASERIILPELRDLVAYLVAAHHGKVRLSIRSLPDEKSPAPKTTDDGRDRRFARGVWDADDLPSVDLGGMTAPAVRLSLEPMELGLCEEAPFRGQPSWMERMLRLRDTFGPFHLAFLEALLRAADIRVSRRNVAVESLEQEMEHA